MKEKYKFYKRKESHDVKINQSCTKAEKHETTKHSRQKNKITLFPSIPRADTSHRFGEHVNRGRS